MRVSCIYVADGGKIGSGFSLIRGFSAIRPLGLLRQVRLRVALWGSCLAVTGKLLKQKNSQ